MRGTPLSVSHPEIAAQWHPEKNGDLIPANFSAGSGVKVWWLCDQGHEWEAVIGSRYIGRGCPVCAGKQVLVGFNDLQTTNPGLAEEWHPTKNGELSPEDVLAGSERKVWWLCPKGHSYEGALNGRKRGRGCSVCSGKKILVGETDLKTANPNLAAEWHPYLNGELSPEDVHAGSERKVWWICPIGHEYISRIKPRTRGVGCSVCSGKQVLLGYNDLATTNPELASEWHPTRNGILTPQEVLAGSEKKVWWRCSVGHETESRINGRSRGRGCSICAGKQLLVGFNDLATTNSALLSEWHPTLNGSLTLQQVSKGMNTKVWWLCAKGHAWQSPPNGKLPGQGCSVCDGKQVLVGYNDLATTNPELASEWHPTKNKLSPDEVLAGTHKKVWWLCQHGHEWQAEVNSRRGGRGCPGCAVPGFDPTKPGIFYFIISYSLNARKVGITNVGTDRLAHFENNEWEKVLLVQHERGIIVRHLESAILSWIRKDLSLPEFLGKEEMGRRGGWTETFSLEGPTNEEIIERINAELQRLVN
jgi:hypothetical protein